MTRRPPRCGLIDVEEGRGERGGPMPDDGGTHTMTSIYAGRRPSAHYDDPNRQAIARAFDVPMRMLVNHPWPYFVLLPRLARLHRRLR